MEHRTEQSKRPKRLLANFACTAQDEDKMFLKKERKHECSFPVGRGKLLVAGCVGKQESAASCDLSLKKHSGPRLKLDQVICVGSQLHSL